MLSIYYYYMKINEAMNLKVKRLSSSQFAYCYCLLFFLLSSFHISKAQNATTDPSEGTFSLYACVCWCVVKHMVFLFSFSLSHESFFIFYLFRINMIGFNIMSLMRFEIWIQVSYWMINLSDQQTKTHTWISIFLIYLFFFRATSYICPLSGNRLKFENERYLNVEKWSNRIGVLFLRVL